MRQTFRMPLFFNLLKDLLVWIMTFVDEDVNRFGKIEVRLNAIFHSLIDHS
jgi:hypothetical protein